MMTTYVLHLDAGTLKPDAQPPRTIKCHPAHLPNRARAIVMDTLTEGQFSISADGESVGYAFRYAGESAEFERA